jgi:exodeoxyribonuclease VII large subunit
MIEKNYIQISALNNYIKLLIDDNSFLHKVYLKGEISNFKNHMSGHLYFTLKDEEARVSAIMFRNKTIDLKFTPEDGKKVLVEGRVSCYPSQGTYQVYVEKMEEDGLGNLYVLFEELKNKLQKEGLFDPIHKKPIPKYPEKIGIVTAPSGAAIKDILSTLKRRYPIAKTILFPALVQGKSAAPDIVKQIEKAKNYDLDILIVGRGGGSIEDLWAFNEEIVARAIYNCPIPTISAVGHEIDYTISDFVADLRAPTPTGAAEMATPTIDEVQKIIKNCSSLLSHQLKNQLNNLEHQLNQLKNSYILKNPSMLYEVKIQKLDYLNEQLNMVLKRFINQKQLEFDKVSNSYILKNPKNLYQGHQEQLNQIKNQIHIDMKRILESKDHQLNLTINTLKLVNPLNLLEKGYTLISKEQKIIKSSKELKIKDKIEIKMKDGSINAVVEEVK